MTGHRAAPLGLGIEHAEYRARAIDIGSGVFDARRAVQV